MGQWQKSTCVLCVNYCGLEVLVEDNRMIKVRPDKANPRSQGYACRVVPSGDPVQEISRAGGDGQEGTAPAANSIRPFGRVEGYL